MSKAGLTIHRVRDPKQQAPPSFVERFETDLVKLRKQFPQIEVFDQFIYEMGDHPATYIHHECEFASVHVARVSPSRILDVGSYRTFVLGMLAGHQVVTVDVRPRDSISKNEIVKVCDAKALDLENGSVDAITSLCAIEHFGLGRYGDDFDPDGDRKAIEEMKRVLRPGGHLIFTTTITRGKRAIAFNAHRIYDHSAIHDLCQGLELVEEQFYSYTHRRLCDYSEVTSKARDFDFYLGCWKKPQ